MKRTAVKLGAAALAAMVVILAAAFVWGALGTDDEGMARNRGGSGSAPIGGDMPIVKKSITLKAFSGYSPIVSSDWNGLPLWSQYERLTGIHVVWQTVPAADLVDRRNLLLSRGSEQWPDLFYAARFSGLDLVSYGSTGVLVPLEKLIDGYAPNVKALLDRYPDIRRGMTMPDGHIYALPMLYDPEFASVLAGRKLWFKRDWLRQLGLEPPETTEQLYELLKQFHSVDLNGNYKHDETALLLQGIDGLKAVLEGAWGLGNRGEKHPLVDVDPLTGSLRFIPATLAYKEMLQYMRRLYEEGLIDNRLFAINENEFLRIVEEEDVGAFVGSGPPAGSDGEYTAGGVLVGPYGDRLFAAVTHPLNQIGAFAITSTNPNPEASIRWADYFYGEEGNRLFFLGPEGVDARGLEPDSPQAIGRNLVWPQSEFPGIVRQATYTGAEGAAGAVAGAQKLKPAFIGEVWPEFTYTPDENDSMIAYSLDIQGYVEEMRKRFVTGEVSFDAWDDYLVTLKRKGQQRFLSIYATAYNRYAGR